MRLQCCGVTEEVGHDDDERALICFFSNRMQCLNESGLARWLRFGEHVKNVVELCGPAGGGNFQMDFFLAN